MTDGKDDTRWAAVRADNEWIYVDLGSEKPVGGVRLNWEAAYGKSYKIQVSNDAKSWTEVYKTEEGREGINEVFFPEEIKSPLRTYVGHRIRLVVRLLFVEHGCIERHETF